TATPAAGSTFSGWSGDASGSTSPLSVTMSADRNITATFTVTQSHTITATAGANGAISPSGAVSVQHAANQAFTITPAAHYHVLDVKVDGVSVGAVARETFNEVTANHSIEASFSQTTHTTTASALANGAMPPRGA